MSVADELAQVAVFREALVAHANLVLIEREAGPYPPRSPDVRIGAEQVRLTREYARLRPIIVRVAGVAAMTLPMVGVTSRDVVQDAISRVDHRSYEDLARFAIEQLDRAIGALQGLAERQPPKLDPERIYRLTSPVYWIGQIARGAARLLQWLSGTARGRVTAAVGAVVLVIVGAIVNGWASAFFTKLFGGP